MSNFLDVFEDVTKKGTKIPTEKYLKSGKYPIIDQGQSYISGYCNDETGLFDDIPVIIFGDHTRIIKYVDQPCFLGADGVKLLKSKDRQANYKYLYYALCSAKIPDTGYNRHFKWLKELEIPLPPLEIQKQIADTLDKVTHTIDLCNAILEKLDLLVKSRFIELFGDPVSNPHNWDKTPLGELAEIKIGPFGTLLHKEDYIQNAHALVNPSHIIDGKIAVDMKLTVSDDKYNELSAYHLNIDDVVMGRRGEMGRCAVVSKSGLLCGTGSMIIRSNGRLKADYIQKISWTACMTIHDILIVSSPRGGYA